MRYFLVAIIPLFITLVSYSQNNPADCIFFKTGNFTYQDSATKNTWTIKRTAKRQTEEVKKTGEIIKNKIKWVSGCEYQLTQTWTSNKERRKRNYTKTIYRIISVAGNKYKYTCNCSDGTTVVGTVIKIPG